MNAIPQGNIENILTTIIDPTNLANLISPISSDCRVIRNWRVGDLPLPDTLPTLWGQQVEQRLSALPAFDNLFAAFKPKRIIELGTGNGGLTLYLGMWAHLIQARLMTVERLPSDATRNVLRIASLVLPITIRTIDYTLEPAIVTEFIDAHTPCLLLCDGATDKAAQMRLFAPYLKPGDVLMGHDYKPELGIDNQLKDTDLGGICDEYGYEPFMQDMWNSYKSHWACLRKRAT